MKQKKNEAFQRSGEWHSAFNQFVRVRWPWPPSATESSLRATFNVSQSAEYKEALRHWRKRKHKQRSSK